MDQNISVFKLNEYGIFYVTVNQTISEHCCPGILMSWNVFYFLHLVYEKKYLE